MNIKEKIEENKHIISVKEQKDLLVLKYKNKVFYKNLWNEFLIECRGLVLDKNYNIVQRPFTKIYNWGENNSYFHHDTKIIAMRKINGFMIAATIHNDELLVSTTGSLTSEFVKLGYKWLKPYEMYIRELMYKLGDVTLIFEIVDETDPHIVKEIPGIYLLGIRKKEWNTPQYFYSMTKMSNIAKNSEGWYFPSFMENISVTDALKICKSSRREGYVLINNDKSIKVKSPYYKITKFLARKRNLDLFSDDIFKTIDEEFYDLIRYLRNINFLEMNEQEKVLTIRAFLHNEY